MRIIIYLVFLLYVCTSCIGCATIIRGSDPQTITINTDPDNAYIEIINLKDNIAAASGASPFKQTLNRTLPSIKYQNDCGYGAGEAYEVIITKPGYSTEYYVICSKTEPMGYLNLISIPLLIMPVILDAIDFMTGAAHYLEPEEINVVLIPDTSDVVSTRSAEMYYKCTSYYNNQDYDNAVRSCTKAIKYNPNFSNAYYYRYKSYKMIEEHAKAMDDIDKAEMLDPNNPLIVYDQGLFYSKQGNIDMAYKKFDRAIQLKPDFLDAIFNRGQIYIKQGKLEDAKIDIKLACQKGFTRACNFQF